MFWNKKSEALQRLEDIRHKFTANFQQIMVDEFEQFHSVKNNADEWGTACATVSGRTFAVRQPCAAARRAASRSAQSKVLLAIR